MPGITRSHEKEAFKQGVQHVRLVFFPNASLGVLVLISLRVLIPPSWGLSPGPASSSVMEGRRIAWGCAPHRANNMSTGRWVLAERIPSEYACGVLRFRQVCCCCWCSETSPPDDVLCELAAAAAPEGSAHPLACFQSSSKGCVRFRFRHLSGHEEKMWGERLHDSMYASRGQQSVAG